MKYSAKVEGSRELETNGALSDRRSLSSASAVQVSSASAISYHVFFSNGGSGAPEAIAAATASAIGITSCTSHTTDEIESTSPFFAPACSTSATTLYSNGRTQGRNGVGMRAMRTTPTALLPRRLLGLTRLLQQLA